MPAKSGVARGERQFGRHTGRPRTFGLARGNRVFPAPDRFAHPSASFSKEISGGKDPSAVYPRAAKPTAG